MNRNAESEILQHVLARIPSLFRRHGIDVDVCSRGVAISSQERRADARFMLNVDERHFPVDVRVAGRISGALLASYDEAVSMEPGVPMLLVVPRLTKIARQRLRERRAHFADLTGAIHLHLPGIRIDVDGAEPVALPPRTKQTINPFSKHASKVLRRLFQVFPEPLRVSALAQQATISLGWASQVTEELVSRAYVRVAPDGVTLQDPVSALSDWMSAYDWRKNARRSYVLPYERDELATVLSSAFEQHGVQWASTLLFGVNQRVGYVQPYGAAQVYAFAERPDVLQLALQDMHAEQVQEGSNLELFESYYGAAVLTDHHRIAGTPVVSDVQLLLDVAHYPLRGAEAAEILVRRCLATSLQLDRGDVTRLLEVIHS